MKYGIKHTLESIYLCIKYPFLYPRNRWNDLHYNNWVFEEKINGKRNLWKRPMIEKEGWYQKGYILNIDQETFKSTREVKNWWYAILYQIGNFIYNYPMQWLHCIPTYTEWDVMDSMPGWKKAFGKQYLDELKAQLKKDHYLYQFRITDIKEKYGTLRLYCVSASDEVYRIIDKYENLSYETCIECGKPADIITDGYVLPYCMRCWSSMEHKRKIGMYKIDGKTWVNADEIIVTDRTLGDMPD